MPHNFVRLEMQDRVLNNSLNDDGDIYEPVENCATFFLYFSGWVLYDPYQISVTLTVN